MADLTHLDAPVELASAMDAGFQEAMARVKALALDPKSTLVDAIPQDEWLAWDKSGECANVIDAGPWDCVARKRINRTA